MAYVWATLPVAPEKMAPRLAAEHSTWSRRKQRAAKNVPLNLYRLGRSVPVCVCVCVCVFAVVDGKISSAEETRKAIMFWLQWMRRDTVAVDGRCNDKLPLLSSVPRPNDFARIEKKTSARREVFTKRWVSLRRFPKEEEEEEGE